LPQKQKQTHKNTVKSVIISHFIEIKIHSKKELNKLFCRLKKGEALCLLDFGKGDDLFLGEPPRSLHSRAVGLSAPVPPFPSGNGGTSASIPLAAWRIRFYALRGRLKPFLSLRGASATMRFAEG
jgi:hypothetical protein